MARLRRSQGKRSARGVDTIPGCVFHEGTFCHSVAPPLRENPIALIHGVNALRHRALAASGCPGPKDCRL